MEIKIGGLYKHFKTGKTYKVIGIAKHSETLEPMVIYEAQYENPEGKLWARPVKMWDEEVEWSKGSGKMVQRFLLIE